MTLDQWATRHGVSHAALAELRALMGREGAAIVAPDPKRPADPASEAYVQSLVRLEAARADIILWRNNVGALLDTRGVPVRYGLANDNAAMNKRIKSGDLIGIRKVLIGPQHIGRTMGLFVSREVKHAAWKYRGDAHEQAQQRWLDLVLAYGGDAAFAAGPGSFGPV